jgi:nucleoside-specific outer membrane channel protein Tsx
LGGDRDQEEGMFATRYFPRLGTAVWMGAVLALFACGSAPAHAQNYSSTNVQFLYGGNFHDGYYGYNTTSGDMFTLTLENTNGWKYGDNYLFLDLRSGGLADFAGKATGDKVLPYAEWYPRLSLSKLSGHKVGFGPISDVHLAGAVEMGKQYRSSGVGLSLDLKVPGFDYFTVYGMSRDDNYNSTTFQSTVCWCKPFRVRNLRGSLEGYVDFAGTDRDGLDINMQPQLLFDVSRRLGQKDGKAQLGLEWYYHRNKHATFSVPQVVFKWKFN